MQDEKNTPTLDDFCKELEKPKTSNQIRQSMVASRLLNPLLEGSLPKEMNEKLAVFRTPAISECITCGSIQDISNIEKKAGDANA